MCISFFPARRKWIPGWAALVFLLAAGCEADRELPDLSNTPPVDIRVRRFEQDLFALDTARLDTSLAQLRADYPAFSEVYFRYLIPLDRGDFSPAEQQLVLRSFLADTLSRALYDLVQEQYPTTEQLEADLETALHYLRYYLPEVPLPQDLTTYLSQFQYAGFLYGDNQLGAGLDLFLGEAFDYSAVDPQAAIFSRYLTRTYNRQHFVEKMMRLLLEDLIPQPRNGRLLDYMIQNGKKLYLLDQVLPLTPDSIKLEITAEQVDWLRDNELQLWVYLNDEELLYSTDIQEFRKLIEESPNGGAALPPEAPGRAANWLGWQIVRSYLERQPETTVAELLALEDAQAVLQASRYKPRR
jgi:hypothetical protein